MIEAGEVLVRRRLRRSSDGLAVPLQLQVLEADFLDATKSGGLGKRRLVQGIEFDAIGRRRAYWLHAEHPGDAYGALQNGLQSRPAPAAEIAATNAKLNALGLVLDSDPRRVTKTGSAQSQNRISDPANEPADDEPTAYAETDPAQAAQQD